MAESVLVSAENYADIRLRLTRAGLANNSDASNDGEAILLKDSSFGVSQRMESERLKLSRERQLASAIEQFQNVAKAQVLLAIPKDNVFARNERKPSATVVLSLKGNALGQGEVDSIVDMVASAVHGLEPTRVTVTDQNGRLLNSGSQDPLSAQTRKEFAMQQKQELEYKQKIDAILIPVLGADNYTAEVDLPRLLPAGTDPQDLQPGPAGGALRNDHGREQRQRQQRRGTRCPLQPAARCVQHSRAGSRRRRNRLFRPFPQGSDPQLRTGHHRQPHPAPAGRHSPHDGVGGGRLQGHPLAPTVP